MREVWGDYSIFIFVSSWQYSNLYYTFLFSFFPLLGLFKVTSYQPQFILLDQFCVVHSKGFSLYSVDLSFILFFQVKDEMFSRAMLLLYMSSASASGKALLLSGNN